MCPWPMSELSLGLIEMRESYTASAVTQFIMAEFSTHFFTVDGPLNKNGFSLDFLKRLF